MRRSIAWKICLALVLPVMLLPVRARADHDGHDGHDGGDRDDPKTVTVNFGIGLNTAALGEPNHHVLPRVIEIEKGGIVNFVVSGFHQIFVYNPGTTPDDVLAHTPPFGPPAIPVTPANLFINYGIPVDPAAPLLYYVGINPGGFTPSPPLPPANPATPPAAPLLSNTFNRVESVAFTTKGRFLVICNINPHFRNGMWAWVKVSD